MKNAVLFFCLMTVSVFGQVPLEKVASRVKIALEKDLNGEQLIWVFFKDKGNISEDYYSHPEKVVTSESMHRREKVNHGGSLIDFDDIPVNPAYIQQTEELGFTVTQKTKWFNGISGYASANLIKKISELPFVKNVDLVERLKKSTEVIEQEKAADISVNKNSPEQIYSLNYGTSITQLQQINVPALHDLGFKGQGVKIAMFDAGFDNLSHECFSQMNIAAKWDFVNHDSVVANQADSGEGSHGTMTLSTIGGFKEGQLIGPAYMATFFLAKTENTDSETPIEENNWIAAVEWADSLGADVISSSLGYSAFDAPWTSYTWQNMDGKTCRSTLGALIAMRKGIVVVNSAGNEGYNPDHNTLIAPADADSIITAGAVDSQGIRSTFSSVGPTSDGRIKPDVVAMGSSVKVATSYPNVTGYRTANGTSFSCPLTAGVAALILCKNPDLTPVQVRDALRLTASQNSSPNNLLGYGIINALNAANYWTPAGVDNKEIAVKDFKLFQNYPNPFNPSTNIRFYIPADSKVKISLFNIIGSEVKVLFDGDCQSGLHEVKLDGSDLSSGVYFVKLNAGSYQQAIKITLTK